MMDSHENNGGPRTSDAGGNVRRRPPTAAYATAPSHSYGTSEEESLLSSSHNEEGYRVYAERSRRPSSGLYYHSPWYRQPQKLILVAGFAWVGSVMYLASLAHSILHAHKETAHVMGSSMRNNYGNYKLWLDSQASSNKYGDKENASDEHVKQWLESQGSNYGATGETNGDFEQWMESESNKAKYGASNGDAYLDYIADTQSSNAYGTGSKGNSHKTKDPEPPLGSTDANYQEWLEYQNENREVKYNANGMYDKSRKGVNNLAASRSIMSQSQSTVATSDSSLSTIDWPLQGLLHTSCTESNGCKPSSNVTVLVVYGPEYHTHISEMAWNVATGVHTAFQSHIKHHPSSPLHGHIVFGHTSNVTYLDVMDADAVIIGSPVYNGNVHPDVQNWINYWHIDADLSNKFGGAFATAGGIHAGADGTIMSILRSMMVFQMMAVGGDSWTSPFGAVATMYEDPFGDTQRTSYFDSNCYYTTEDGRQGDHLVHPYFLRKAYGLGERIANVTVAWKNSSYVRWG